MVCVCVCVSLIFFFNFGMWEHIQPRLDHIFIWPGPCPSHASFTARFSCPHLHGNSSPLGTNVTILNHLSHWAPLACGGSPSISLGIMKVMSPWKYVILTMCYHIGSQRGRIPTHVLAGRQESEGGMGRVGHGRMKMWSSLGHHIQNLSNLFIGHPSIQPWFWINGRGCHLHGNFNRHVHCCS